MSLILILPNLGSLRSQGNHFLSFLGTRGLEGAGSSDGGGATV